MDNQHTPGAEGATPQPYKETFKEGYLRRVREVKTSRWLRFGIVVVLFLLLLTWMNTWWPLILLPLLYDIYITGYIPLTWWKKSKSGFVRTVMSWVDAIVYALVLVYFVFLFIGQNYQIPSSSLEKTLLTGDYLWVNKYTYGPRLPITPIHFPLTHNTLPILNCDSYLSVPEMGYKRLRGLRNVEIGDIVVFNFPAGDTVATKFEGSPEYYEILSNQFGSEYIKAHPETFGEVKYRPVDRRENYVKRAVGLPGQRFKIVDNEIYVDGKKQTMPENVQFNYALATYAPIDKALADKYDLAYDDIHMIAPTSPDYGNILSWMPNLKATPYIYVMPLTASMLKTLTDDGVIVAQRKVNDIASQGANLFPAELSGGWSIANYGGKNGILIPKKGLTIELTPDNWHLYRRAIRNYERHTNSWLDESTSTVYIDGKPAKTYTFAMDYYFMMGDNRDNSLDSRFWGFVPEDHIVGTPSIVLISFDKDRGVFDGGIRWNRVLKSSNPDKQDFK